MTEPDDILRAFTAALSPAARHAFDHFDAQSILAIRKAVDDGTDVGELARIASVGITRTTVNGRGLVRYRLLRESGLLEDNYLEETSN